MTLRLSAQQPTPAAQTAADLSVAPGERVLDEVIVTAPLGYTLFEQAQAVSILTGKKLQQSLEPTLGQTLSRLPGVSGSYFGPVASRPIIRGLDGDRIRVLQNGLNTIDASSASVDHAVSFDVSNLTSIEVVRGPATLLYGSSAIGGVVNAVDNRIPIERMDTISGSLGSSYSSVDNGYLGSLMVEGGNGPVAFHFETFTRAADDLTIPGNSLSSAYRKKTGEEGSEGTLPGSNLRSEGMSGGVSYIWDKGYIGASLTGYHTNYASPAEAGVSIDMEQRRLDVRGAFFDPLPLIKEVNYRFAFSDYEHTEFEGTEAGTVFANTGFDGRVEVKHEKIGGFEGVLGFQSDRSNFSADGEEAFLPTVITQANSAFVFEEREFGSFRLQIGGRYDHITVESQNSNNPNFGQGEARTFDNFSGSLGAVYNPSDDYALALTANYSERAPNYQELFANGAHLATGVFEVGDSSLPTEKSLGLDLNVRKRTGWVTGSIGGYYNRFINFIGLFPTGTLDVESGFPVMAFRSTTADFLGAELETTLHLLHPATDAPPLTDQQDLNLEFKADAVRARDRTTDAPLPRIPPVHFTTALAYQRGPFGARIEGVYAAQQDRVSDEEPPTDSYFLLNASVSYTITRGRLTTDLYIKGVNLINEEAREHTSFLKDRAPLGGRGLVAGVKIAF